jgi:hypothetical protein
MRGERLLLLGVELAPPVWALDVGCFKVKVGGGEFHTLRLLAAIALVVAHDHDVAEAHPHEAAEHGLCVWQEDLVADLKAAHVWGTDGIYPRPVGEGWRDDRLDPLCDELRDPPRTEQVEAAGIMIAVIFEHAYWQQQGYTPPDGVLDLERPHLLQLHHPCGAGRRRAGLHAADASARAA